jgi:lipopolysaccharide transport system permease protein
MVMSSYAVLLSNRQLIYMRDLLRELVARDLKLRYKRSVLGIAWTLLNPLTELLVLLLIFRVVLPLDIPNYPSFLFTGILTFGWFQSSLLFAANAIVGNRELIRQPGFSPALLPVVTVTTNLIHFLLALPILLIFLLLSDIRLTSAILALPFLITLQFIFTLSLAYLAAAFHVKFRDTQYLLKVMLQFLFYLSPVFYSADDVPARFQSLYRLNPLVFFVDAYRAILIRGEYPDYTPMLTVVAISAGLLILGIAVFKRASYRFVEELG